MTFWVGRSSPLSSRVSSAALTAAWWPAASNAGSQLLMMADAALLATNFDWFHRRSLAKRSAGSSTLAG